MIYISFSFKSIYSFLFFLIRNLSLIFFLFFCNNFIYSQSNIFEFVKIPVNSKLTSLGGYNVSLSSDENNFFNLNPALLDNGRNKNISLNFIDYIASIKATSINYIDSLKSIGKFGIGIKHFNYGKTNSYDALGNYLGELNGNSIELTLSKSKKLGQFIYGVNLKYVLSKIKNINNNGILFDIGGLFYPTYNKDFTIGISLKNFGFLFNNSNSILPFDIQIGSSIKPEYMPLRFSFTVFNIYGGDNLNYNREKLTLNKLISKINFGSEILINKNIILQAGYNFMNRNDINYKFSNRNSGFSYGILLKIKRICINYARSMHNIQGGINSINLSLNFKQLIN